MFDEDFENKKLNKWNWIKKMNTICKNKWKTFDMRKCYIFFEKKSLIQVKYWKKIMIKIVKIYAKMKY